MTTREKEIIVFQGETQRLDRYLASHLDGVTRNQIQMMIHQSLILVNNKAIKQNYMVKTGDLIGIEFFETDSGEIKKQDIPLDIYYEDSDVIVINKPSGMVVHPAVGNKENTLVNALLFHCTDLSGINGKLRPGIVHRIDKDTSGLLVACKNDYSHRILSKQFADKKVTRKYYALVHGVINHNVGVIDAPIGRDPVHRQQMTVIENGKHAITHFRVIERYKNMTLLELQLETGRTHQIRVHMKYIGFPLVGDPVYGLKNDANEKGQFLHAKTLGFIHPRSKEKMEWESPLPSYYSDYLKQLT
ncbi:MAG: RluA family pseudouridine synthase [Bacilli bacterium]|jgi:23S rRNA pseudouridine1911/1915/1917 synthase|nr:RluA family pseudouridine synthase [Bacilli bacterium]MDY0064023.1 RluA family pseudouridine synthase [Bacilli bacterium]